MAFVDRFALAAVSGEVKRTFNLTETGLGALQGLAIAVPYALVAFPSGRLADRLAAKILIVAGLLVWTLGAFGCAFSATAPELWIGRAAIGVGQALFVPASLAFLGRLFTASAVARPISVFTAGSTLGKSIALLAAGAILSLYMVQPALGELFKAPWRTVFVLSAAPNLLLALTFIVLPFPDAPKRARPKGAADGRDGSVFTSATVTFALIALAPIILIQAMASWTPLFYARTFHLAPERAAVMLGVLLLVTAPLGHLLGGQLTALELRRGVGPGRLIGVCLAIAAPLSAALCFLPNLDLSILSYGLLVVVLGVAAPAGLTGIGLLAAPERLGSTNAAFMGLVTLVGVGLGPTIVGAMSDHWFGGARGLPLSLSVLTLGVSAFSLVLVVVFSKLWRSPASGEAWR